MISNIDSEGVKDKISVETSGNAAVMAIFERVAAHEIPYGIEPKAGGLVFSSTVLKDDRPNRCYVKVWQPEPNQLLVWFYKRSGVVHSRDRYSYGGIVWDLATIDLSKTGPDIDSWLEWLDSGLNSDKRPSNWISAFTYDIPE